MLGAARLLASARGRRPEVRAAFWGAALQRRARDAHSVVAALPGSGRGGGGLLCRSGGTDGDAALYGAAAAADGARAWAASCCAATRSALG